MPYCSKCGTEYAENAQYCLHCGIGLSDMSDTSDTDKQNTTDVEENEKSYLIVGCLIINVLIFGFWGIFKFFKNVSGLSQPPIEVTFRESMIDSSRRVVCIRNYSNKAIAGYCTCEDLNGTSSNFNLALKPHQEVEIGWMQGWDFVRGEKITFHIDGYSTSTHNVP